MPIKFVLDVSALAMYRHIVVCFLQITCHFNLKVVLYADGIAKHSILVCIWKFKKNTNSMKKLKIIVAKWVALVQTFFVAKNVLLTIFQMNVSAKTALNEKMHLIKKSLWIKKIQATLPLINYWLQKMYK